MPRITHMLFVDLYDNFSCKENYNLAGRSLIQLVFVWGALWTTTPAALDAYDIGYVTNTRKQIPQSEHGCVFGALYHLLSRRAQKP